MAAVSDLEDINKRSESAIVGDKEAPAIQEAAAAMAAQSHSGASWEGVGALVGLAAVGVVLFSEGSLYLTGNVRAKCYFNQRRGSKMFGQVASTLVGYPS